MGGEISMSSPPISDFQAKTMSTTRIFIFLAAITSIMLLSGCEKKIDDTRIEMSLSEMSGSDIVAKVNGRRIYADEIRRRLAVKLGLKEYSLKNQPGASARLDKFTEAAKQRIVYEMVNSTPVEQYGEEHECAPTEKSWERVVGTFLSDYGNNATLKSVSTAAGIDAADLESVLRRQAYRDDVFIMYDHSISNIQQDAITAVHERIKKFNWNVAESNKVQLATCSALLDRLKNGEDFGTVARTGSEFNEEQGSYWASFAREELEDENVELAKWAFSAKVGSFEGPFEMDNGYAIVKVLSREEGADVVSFAAESVANVSLARINVRQFEEAKPLDDGEIATIIFDSRKKKAEKALLKELHGKMKLEFPHGDNLFGDSPRTAESAQERVVQNNVRQDNGGQANE